MSQEFCAKSKLILVRFLIYLRLRYRLLLPHFLLLFLLLSEPVERCFLVSAVKQWGRVHCKDLIRGGIVCVVVGPLGKWNFNGQARKFLKSAIIFRLYPVNLIPLEEWLAVDSNLHQAGCRGRWIMFYIKYYREGKDFNGAKHGVCPFCRDK